MPRNELCIQCHNAELAPQANGQPGVAAPGSSVHHPMNEMMNGTGAIDVPQGSPSQHKGKCVQCHMVPTACEPQRRAEGEKATAANHTFRIVEPEVAAEALTSAAIGGAVRNMPARRAPPATSRTAPQYALYLQELLDNRQAAMHSWDDQVTTALGAAATEPGLHRLDRRPEARERQQRSERDRQGQLVVEPAGVPEGLHEPAVHRVGRQLGHPQLGLRQDRHPEGPGSGPVRDARVGRHDQGVGHVRQGEQVRDASRAESTPRRRAASPSRRRRAAAPGPTGRP